MPTQQFRVNFTAPTPQAEPANNLHLEGPGTLTFEFDRAVLTPDRATSAYVVQAPEFARSEIANVTLSAPASLVTIRTRDGLRYVSVWARSRREAEQIHQQLPKDVTQAFQAGWPTEEESARKVRLLDNGAPVTTLLIVANVVLYIATVYMASDSSRLAREDYIRMGSLYGPLLWHGEPWRLISSMFLHIDLHHLVGNMIALTILGPMTERFYGSARYALIYLLAGLSGAVLSGCWHPYGNALGASGAIMGILGALGAFAARWPKELAFPEHARIAAGTLTMIGLTLLNGLNPRIDNSAHIGGLLAGFMIAWPLSRGLDPWKRAAANPLLLVRVSVISCGVLALLIAWVMPWR